MRTRSKLAVVIDWVGLFLIVYVVSFIWLFTRVRDIEWASGIALPLALLLLIAAYMLIKKAPWLKTARVDVEAKENALFRLIIASPEDALSDVARAVFTRHGHKLSSVEDGVAYAGSLRVVGVTQGRARPEDILAFYRRVRGASHAVYCSLMEPESGAEAVAARLSAPRVAIYTPTELMHIIEGEPPTPRERETRSRAERARSTWSTFKKHALRHEQAQRYMLYALILFVAYILTGWLWYPVPGLICAALGAASALKDAVVRSPFEG